MIDKGPMAAILYHYLTIILGINTSRYSLDSRILKCCCFFFVCLVFFFFFFFFFWGGGLLEIKTDLYELFPASNLVNVP